MRGKHDIRVEAYGTVDELNSALGLASCFFASCLSASSEQQLHTLIRRIQNHLFDIGSDLCRAENADKTKRFPEKRTLWLEQKIDEHNEALEPLMNFILPAGNQIACSLHLARTIARRAERRVVALAEKEPSVSIGILTYLNRLSDLLFVLARFYNERGKNDLLWKPNSDE